MNGIICINKPQEYTSFDVIARLKGMTKTKKIGHAGTLDPMATGVLPVFVGTSTKAIAVLPTEDKEYEADFKLGATSDTLDIWGNVTLSKADTFIEKEKIISVLYDFKGEIEQTPPMYSAVQIGGRRLYDIARTGVEVERPKRKVTVHEIELLDFNEESQTGKLRIYCSKGTYIRTIIADMGEQLGKGAIMTALVRTKAAGFTLADCITMDEAQEYTTSNTFEEHFLPMSKLFADFPKIRLNPEQVRMFKNGVTLDLNRIKFSKSHTQFAVYDWDKNLLGIASAKLDGMELKIDKLF